MKQNISPTTVIIVIGAVLAVVFGIYLLKGGSVSEAPHDTTATLKDIKPAANAPTVPEGGAVPGVAAPTKLK